LEGDDSSAEVLERAARRNYLRVWREFKACTKSPTSFNPLLNNFVSSQKKEEERQLRADLRSAEQENEHLREQLERYQKLIKDRFTLDAHDF
jgi:hypothetical protein